MAREEFDQLDDYITNRLSPQEREEFEQKLLADADLRRDLRMQQSIIGGIRTARHAELKKRLDALTVDGPVNGRNWWIGGAIAVFIAGGLYLATNEEGSPAPDPVPIQSEPLAETVQPGQNQTSSEVTPAPEATSERQPEAPKQTPARTYKPKAPVAKSDNTRDVAPKVDVFVPADEASGENDTPRPEAPAQPASTVRAEPTITTEVVADSKKYTFHYELEGDKLILFGAFDNNVYEILEFIADNKRTVFLYYRNDYYLLNEQNAGVKPLVRVNDPVLIGKLRDYRGK